MKNIYFDFGDLSGYSILERLVKFCGLDSVLLALAEITGEPVCTSRGWVISTTSHEPLMPIKLGTGVEYLSRQPYTHDDKSKCECNGEYYHENCKLTYRRFED